MVKFSNTYYKTTNDTTESNEEVIEFESVEELMRYKDYLLKIPQMQVVMDSLLSTFLPGEEPPKEEEVSSDKPAVKKKSSVH